MTAAIQPYTGAYEQGDTHAYSTEERSGPGSAVVLQLGCKRGGFCRQPAGQTRAANPRIAAIEPA